MQSLLTDTHLAFLHSIIISQMSASAVTRVIGLAVVPGDCNSNANILRSDRQHLADSLRLAVYRKIFSSERTHFGRRTICCGMGMSSFQCTRFQSIARHKRRAPWKRCVKKSEEDCHISGSFFRLTL